MTLKLLAIGILALSISLNSASAWAELTGKTLRIRYENGAEYNVKYGADILTWTGLRGADAGRSESDKYELSTVTEKVFMVRWKEQDGTIVHSLLNLNEGTALASIWTSPEMPFLRGRLSIIEQLGHK